MGRRRKKDLADKKKKRACAHCGQPITFPIGEFEPLCDKCEDKDETWLDEREEN